MHFPSTFSSYTSLLKEEDNLNENEVERVMMALLRSDDARSEGRKFQRWSQRRRWSWWTKICFHFQSEGKKSGGMELREGRKKRKWRSPVVYRLNFLQANIWHRLGYSNAPLLSSAPHPPTSLLLKRFRFLLLSKLVLRPPWQHDEMCLPHLFSFKTVVYENNVCLKRDGKSK